MGLRFRRWGLKLGFFLPPHVKSMKNQEVQNSLLGPGSPGALKPKYWV